MHVYTEDNRKNIKFISDKQNLYNVIFRSTCIKLFSRQFLCKDSRKVLFCWKMRKNTFFSSQVFNEFIWMIIFPTMWYFPQFWKSTKEFRFQNFLFEIAIPMWFWQRKTIYLNIIGNIDGALSISMISSIYWSYLY